MCVRRRQGGKSAGKTGHLFIALEKKEKTFERLKPRGKRNCAEALQLSYYFFEPLPVGIALSESGKKIKEKSPVRARQGMQEPGYFVADIALYAAFVRQGLFKIKLHEAVVTHNDMAEGGVFENKARLAQLDGAGMAAACSSGKTCYKLLLADKRLVSRAYKL